MKSWKVWSPMNSKRSEHAMLAINGSDGSSSMVVCCGGDNNGMFLKSTEMITISSDSDSSKQSWKRMPQMKEARIKASLVYDSNKQYLYFIGGNNGFGSVRGVQRLDMEKCQKWELLQETLYDHDDYPYVWIDSPQSGLIGVCGHDKQFGCVEYFDSRSNEWLEFVQYPTQPHDKTTSQSHIVKMCDWFF
ncbi:hypothetical protein RFI_19243 [Reticulomyxa filosa]|uniref:Kelch repeat-containing protein n=1 Tax=Reticulomyxa filosa TaxID=46433 RepID=X6MX48_RETFI|nr:hypothetical protein RFI_19243 [Reticulomyxa filosa]|eukprot:ETO18052.1 hypothetical protein RFI_19243 [Reticulomyxa filosa]